MAVKKTTQTEEFKPAGHWKCPATEYAEPADRGHRFQAIYRTDPHEPDRMFCERCGISVILLAQAPA